jgi:flagellar motility protein MotE (MotC chaperone)
MFRALSLLACFYMHHHCMSGNLLRAGVVVQAAKDHAAECEQRATTAEANLKTVQHELHTARVNVEDSNQDFKRAQSRHEEELKGVHERSDIDLQKARSLTSEVCFVHASCVGSFWR